MNALRLVDELRSLDQRGVGLIQHNTPGVPNVEKLMLLDREAASIQSWNVLTIPGLLRTADYASAAVQASQPSLSAQEVIRRADQQAARSRAFEERLINEGPGLVAGRVDELSAVRFIVGERAIREPLGGHGRSAVRAHMVQLEALLSLMETYRQKVVIRIWPEHLLPPGLDDHCMLYELEGNGVDEPIVYRLGYVETVLGAFYCTRSRFTDRAQQLFDAMMYRAMSAEYSERFIKEMVSS